MGLSGPEASGPCTIFTRPFSETTKSNILLLIVLYFYLYIFCFSLWIFLFCFFFLTGHLRRRKSSYASKIIISNLYFTRVYRYVGIFKSDSRTIIINSNLILFRGCNVISDIFDEIPCTVPFSGRLKQLSAILFSGFSSKYYK